MGVGTDDNYREQDGCWNCRSRWFDYDNEGMNPLPEKPNSGYCLLGLRPHPEPASWEAPPGARQIECFGVCDYHECYPPRRVEGQ